MKTDRKIICGHGFCAVTEDGRLVDGIGYWNGTVE